MTLKQFVLYIVFALAGVGVVALGRGLFWTCK